eukprot:PhF_6_TR13634/c0_g1_i1/m.21851/K15332/TRMT2A; tRNA (uracil-5-)-methyltransferase
MNEDAEKIVASASEGEEEEILQEEGGGQDETIHLRSNTHLVKMNVGDHKLTATDIKKKVAARSGGNTTTNSTGGNQIAAYLPGCVRLGKNPTSPFAFFSFQTEEQRQAGIEMLERISHKGTTWKTVTLREEDLTNFGRVNAAAAGAEGGTNTSKRQREGGEGEGTGDNTAPWKDVSYEEQLRRKYNHCEDVLRKMSSELMYTCRHERVPFPAWLQEHNKNSPCCELLVVHPSPVIVGYRNRTDLTVGYDEQGQPLAGFNSGAVRDGIFTVADPSVSPTISIEALDLASRFTDFIRTPALLQSLKPYNKGNHTGFWRRIMVRQTVHGSKMLVIQSTSQYPPDLPREAVQKLCVETFGSLVNSLQWQEWDGMSNAAPTHHPHIVLSGTDTIQERVLQNLDFNISPNSFFQVNTHAAERLLQRAAQVSNLTPNTILLDLCCGTGFIGLCLARFVNYVIGVEMVEDAIADAKRNAVLQGTTNVEYICGRLENVTSLIQGAIAQRTAAAAAADNSTPFDVVAVVDPARGGLHNKVIKWLRETALIRNLVYISCDQRALVRDCVGLLKATSKQYKNDPYVPVSSFGVDLFPHTPHVEQVVVFRR